MPSPAALGLVTDDDHQLTIPDSLKFLVQHHRNWVDHLGAPWAEKEADSPGRIVGFPRTSIYEGIEEDIVKYESWSEGLDFDV